MFSFQLFWSKRSPDRNKSNAVFTFLAPSQFQCDCGEHEECFNDECVCQEGYEIDEYGDCVWPDEGKINN